MVQEGRQIALGDYASDVSWRPPFTGTADVPAVLGQWEAGATIVLQALHVSWQPLARLLPRARGGARVRRPGERVLHAARVAGLRGAPRLARRADPPGRGREAVAALRPAARAPAQAPALQPRPRRRGRAGRRSRPEGGRHDVPAARLAPPGRDVRQRLAAPHDRDRHAHVGRRGARRARRARGRRDLPARRRARRGRRPARRDRRAARPGARRAAACGGSSSSRAGRSARTDSRSCARSRASTRTPCSSGARP